MEAGNRVAKFQSEVQRPSYVSKLARSVPESKARFSKPHLAWARLCRLVSRFPAKWQPRINEPDFVSLRDSFFFAVQRACHDPTRVQLLGHRFEQCRSSLQASYPPISASRISWFAINSKLLVEFLQNWSFQPCTWSSIILFNNFCTEKMEQFRHDFVGLIRG